MLLVFFFGTVVTSLNRSCLYSDFATEKSIQSPLDHFKFEALLLCVKIPN